MTDLEVLDRNINELKSWLDAAWRHLARPSLTKMEHGELRSEMRRCNAELRRCLEQVRAERARPRTPSSPANRVAAGGFRLIGPNPPA